MTEEDYLAWREQPMTQWFMAAFKNTASVCEHEWKDGSWASGEADQGALDMLKAKHAAYSSVFEADFSDIEARQDEHQRD